MCMKPLIKIEEFFKSWVYGISKSWVYGISFLIFNHALLYTRWVQIGSTKSKYD